MQFSLGTAKGGVGGVDAKGNPNTVVQDPFVYATMTEDRAKYTGEAVVETVADKATDITLGWTPVVKGAFTDDEGNAKDVKIISADGKTITYADVVDGKVAAAAGSKVYYKYDNQVVPQDKLPTFVGRMQGIALQARARRIAVQYSQFAAFQS
jgi:hypothetical protein